MNTNLDCIPCFFSQALGASRQSGLDEAGQKEAVDAVARLVPGFSLSAKPPQMALAIHHAVKRIAGVCDPYMELKRKSNEAAMAIGDRLSDRIADADDPLREAVSLALAGNVIDYGARVDLDLARELECILSREPTADIDVATLRSALKRASRVLVIGDNAGEIVFDKLLIRTVEGLFPTIETIYAVRSSPIINDVTFDDARQIGLTEVCRVIESGSPAPGALLGYATDKFRMILESADVVIAKGQGNFEALSDEGLNIFFLFRAKCRPIADSAQVELGAFVLQRR